MEEPCEGADRSGVGRRGEGGIGRLGEEHRSYGIKEVRVLPPTCCAAAPCSGSCSCSSSPHDPTSSLLLTVYVPSVFYTPPTHNQEPYDTLLY